MAALVAARATDTPFAVQDRLQHGYGRRGGFADLAEVLQRGDVGRPEPVRLVNVLEQVDEYRQRVGAVAGDAP